MDFVIGIDDPRMEDVRALVERHSAFSRQASPPGHDHALDQDGLSDPAVTLFSARRDGLLLGVGALKELDTVHGELKSMHTSETARGRGVARAMVAHLLSVAADPGYRTVSIETGAQAAFAPARSLYAKAGFRPCPPFGEYAATPHSTWMTIDLERRPSWDDQATDGIGKG